MIIKYILVLLWQMRDPKGGKRGVRSVSSAERTRILVHAEQGNQVKVLNTWTGDETILSSCEYKVLFPYGENLCAVKTGHWKDCNGPERRRKERAVSFDRNGETPECASQKTYRTTERLRN